MVAPRKPTDIQALRTVLAMSQKQMAAVLGISIRAVQSYEQGWRQMPPATQKLVSLLLFLHWRRDHKAGAPCWTVNQCESAVRDTCFAHQCRARDCCWIVTGNCHRGQDMKSWSAKLDKCTRCKVMGQWLEPEPAAPVRRKKAATHTCGCSKGCGAD